MEENEIEYVVNFITNTGVNIIAELVFMDDHTFILNRPIEIKKRPVPTKTGGLYEAITTSPLLVMTSDFKTTISRSNIFTNNELHPELYDMYAKLADKYYIDISDMSEDLEETISGTGTIH